MSPVEASMPVLRAPERPWVDAFGSTVAAGKATWARASRASLWSITTMISSTGRRCACTDVTAWQSCSQRASV